jgi:hypothetical protein
LELSNLANVGVSGNLDVLGTSNLANVTVGNLVVLELSNLANVGVSGNLDVLGSLNLSNVTAGNLVVLELSNLANVGVSGNLDVLGSLNLSNVTAGNLVVLELSNLANVGVSGNLDVLGSLNLSNVTAGNLVVSGVTDTGALTFSDENKIRIGLSAGETGQGANTIAIGGLAGQTNQHSNTIVMNTTGVALDTDGSGRLFIAPIRSVPGFNLGNKPIKYNTSSLEVVYEDNTDVLVLGANTTGVNQPFAVSDTGVLQVYNNATTTSLASLTDTQITSLGNNQVLTYNSDLTKWVNSSNVTVAGVLTTSNIQATNGGNLDIRSVLGNINITANHDIILTSNSHSTIKLIGPAGSSSILMSMNPDGNSYINFGSVGGAAGQGLRYTGGNIQIKSDIGEWLSISNTSVVVAGRVVPLGGSNIIEFQDLTGTVNTDIQIPNVSIDNIKIKTPHIHVNGKRVELGGSNTIAFSDLSGSANGSTQLIDGSVTNIKLANSSITLGGRVVQLGGSNTIATSNLSDVSFPIALANNDIMSYSTPLGKWTNSTIPQLTGELGYYGAFYDTTTQLNTAAPIVPRAMKCNTTSEAKGVSVDANGVFTVDHAGVYNIQFSAQITKIDSGDDIIHIWFRKNGVDIPDSDTVYTVVGNSGKLVASLNYVETLAANSNIQIMWYSTDTAISLLANTAITTPIPIPGIPSVIVTFTPVQHIQQGTLALGDLLNVNTTAQANNSVLQYNSTLNRWDARANLTIEPGNLIVFGGTTNISSATGTGNILINSGNVDIVVSGEAHIHNNLRVTGNIFMDSSYLANITSPIAGNLNISASNLNIRSTAKSTITGNTSLAGNLSVTSTLASSSTTTGALVVSGGTGISGNAYVGGSIFASQALGNIPVITRTAYNAALNTELTLQTFKLRLNSSTLFQIAAVSTNIDIYWSGVTMVSSVMVASSFTNSGGTISTAWTNVSTTSLGSGGDTIIATIHDTTNGFVYRCITTRCSVGAFLTAERLV